MRTVRIESDFRYVCASLAKRLQTRRMLELQDGSQWLPQTWERIMVFLESRGRTQLSCYVRRLVEMKAKEGSTEAVKAIRVISHCDKLAGNRADLKASDTRQLTSEVDRYLKTVGRSLTK